MKFFLIGVIFIIFVVLAIIIYLIYNFRYKFYKDMVFICKALKNNINFKKSDIDTILFQVNFQIHKSSRFIINNLKNKQISILKKDDCEEVSKFFSSLGYGDIDYEIKNIDYYENRFKDNETLSRDELINKGNVFLKIIIGIGIIICILLI